MTTSALNARAKLFVPGVGIVTPERGGARAREGAARNPFEDDDRLATTARARDDAGSISALSSEDDDAREAAVELDASTLSMDGREGAATMEWVRFDDDDDDDDDDGEGEDATTANDADDAVRDAPAASVSLLKHASSFHSDAYGASAESPRVEDNATLREPLLRRGDSYGAVEDAVENSPQIVLELDAVDDAVPGESMSAAARESGAAEPLLATNASLAEYGAKDDGDSPREWRDVRVPLLPVVKESTYGAASPIRPVQNSRGTNVRKVKELEVPPPIQIGEETNASTKRELNDSAAQTPLLGKSSSGPNLMSYGAVEKQVHGGAVAEGEDEIDLRHFLQSNTAPYERLDEYEEEDYEYDAPARDIQMDDTNDVDVESPLPSAPPLIESIEFTHARPLVDDLCCIVWTVARERLDLLQPLFRLQGSSIGRITLAHLRNVMEKLEPQRASPRALDRLEAMLCACGYVEDVTLSEFVHATHAGTLAATRLSTASGANEAAVLCGYLSELMSRTPASAQTALMLGGRRHKAWLDLPRLLAKNLEPNQLCLLVATLDLADDLTAHERFVDMTVYQSWLRRMQTMLRSTPMPRKPLETVAQNAPAPPTPKELMMRRAKRDRLVALWEEREARRRGNN